MLDPSLAGYSDGRAKAYYAQLRERLEALPGVESVALADVIPLGASVQTTFVHIEEQEPTPKGRELEIDFAIVGPGYLSTMGIPVLEGREFTERDFEGAPGVALVNETMARRFWAGSPALGQRLSTEGPAGPYLEVVGVVKDGKYRTLGRRRAPICTWGSCNARSRRYRSWCEPGSPPSRSSRPCGVRSKRSIPTFPSSSPRP
jgi:hypothetical protein